MKSINGQFTYIYLHSKFVYTALAKRSRKNKTDAMVQNSIIPCPFGLSVRKTTRLKN